MWITAKSRCKQTEQQKMEKGSKREIGNNAFIKPLRDYLPAFLVGVLFLALVKKKMFSRYSWLSLWQEVIKMHFSIAHSTNRKCHTVINCSLQVVEKPVWPELSVTDRTFFPVRIQVSFGFCGCFYEASPLQTLSKSSWWICEINPMDRWNITSGVPHLLTFSIFLYKLISEAKVFN